MNETLDAIVSAITPFLCVFLAFGVFLLIRRRHKFNVAVWAVVACAVFALIWRVIYKLESSRYAMTLVLPAVLLSCYAIWHLHAFFPRRYKTAVKYLKILLMVAVPLIFLAKSWNFSPYRNSLKELAEIARHDAKNYPCTSFAGIDIHDESFEYYSGIPPSKILSFNISMRKNADLSFLKPLEYIVDSDNTLYFAVQIDPQKEKEFVDELGKYPGSFTKLGEKWVNNKKKKKYMLFRYEHRQQPHAMTTNIAVGSTKKNLLSNGEFEKVVPIPDYMVNFCIKKQMVFYNKTGVFVPERVELSGLGNYNRRSEAEAIGDGAIAGKYSMRMKNNSRFMITDAVPPADGKFSIMVKALSNAELKLHAFLYNPGFTENRCIATRKIPVSKSVWKYEITIPREALMPCKLCRIVLVLNYGEILLDNVRFEKL